MRPAALLGRRYLARAAGPRAPISASLFPRFSRIPVQPSFLLLIGTVVLAAIAVYGQSLDTLSWLLVVAGASLAALLAVRSILRVVEVPEPLGTAEVTDETPGELRALGYAWERARSGYVYSRTLVATRAAVAFLEKVRLTRGLSPEDIERATTDRVLLRALIGDPALADFVYEHDSHIRETPLRAASRDVFSDTLTQALDAMEAWS